MKVGDGQAIAKKHTISEKAEHYVENGYFWVSLNRETMIAQTTAQPARKLYKKRTKKPN